MRREPLPANTTQDDSPAPSTRNVPVPTGPPVLQQSGPNEDQPTRLLPFASEIPAAGTKPASGQRVGDFLLLEELGAQH